MAHTDAQRTVAVDVQRADWKLGFIFLILFVYWISTLGHNRSLHLNPDCPAPPASSGEYTRIRLLGARWALGAFLRGLLEMACL